MAFAASDILSDIAPAESANVGKWTKADDKTPFADLTELERPSEE